MNKRDVHKEVIPSIRFIVVALSTKLSSIMYVFTFGNYRVLVL